MKLSEHTLNILKNYSTINEALQFTKGNVLRTIAPQQNIYSKAVIEEEFTRDFALMDVQNFLKVLNLFDNPVIELHETKLNISDETKNQTVDFVYCSPSLIISPPSSEIIFPEHDINVEFTLNSEDLNDVLKASVILSTVDISIFSENGKIFIQTFDVDNQDANSYRNHVGDCDPTLSFNYKFKSEHFKMIRGYSYIVRFASSSVSAAYFKAEDTALEYFIAIQN